MAVWDLIWENDSYSNIELRKIKTVYKVDSFYKFLNLNKEDLCIDLGCGGGYISAEIIKRCNCKVIGFDISKIAIEFAKKTIQYKVMNFL